MSKTIDMPEQAWWGMPPQPPKGEGTIMWPKREVSLNKPDIGDYIIDRPKPGRTARFKVIRYGEDNLGEDYLLNVIFEPEDTTNDQTK